MKLGFVASPQFAASLNVLLESSDLPVKTMFKLRNIVKVVREKITEHDETRNQIVNKYARKDENGNLVYIENDKVSFPPEHTAAVNKALTDLYNIDVEFVTISVEELGDFTGLKGKDFANLEFIVE